MIPAMAEMPVLKAGRQQQGIQGSSPGGQALLALCWLSMAAPPPPLQGPPGAPGSTLAWSELALLAFLLALQLRTLARFVPVLLLMQIEHLCGALGNVHSPVPVVTMLSSPGIGRLLCCCQRQELSWLPPTATPAAFLCAVRVTTAAVLQRVWLSILLLPITFQAATAVATT